ncbi:MAG: carbamoyltransferase [Myxococcota bacterium]
MILGINCYMQDSAACLLDDRGEIVAAVEEERLSRIKHTGRFPELAIRWCLEQAGHPDVRHTAFNMKPWRGLASRAGQAVAGLPQSLDMVRTRGSSWGDMARVRSRLADSLGRSDFRHHWISHHRAHAASAFYASDFDEAQVLVADGSGELASTTLWIGDSDGLRLVHCIDFPNSFGYFYSAMTQWLGFTPAVAEGKVMGLSAYAEPDPAMARFFSSMLQGDGRIDASWFGYQHGGTRYYSERWVDAFGAPRAPESDLTDLHYRVAASGQHRLEEVLFGLLRTHYSGSRNLCLAGGVALNCAMNGKIVEQTPYERIFVQPAAQDAGTAYGAALAVHCEQLGRLRPPPMRTVAHGPAFDERSIDEAIAQAGLTAQVSNAPAVDAARLLADGLVLGWFQGRTELGPRALGQRSILADPRSADMVARVNDRVKHREGFRPFAPAVLASEASDWFEGTPTPFMTVVCTVRPSRRTQIAAVTHVNGTARVQTVSPAQPEFHALITAFAQLTGVPMVLNTSFNVRGEPIVCRPAEAIHDFLATDMDALMLENRLIRKN